MNDDNDHKVKLTSTSGKDRQDFQRMTVEELDQRINLLVKEKEKLRDEYETVLARLKHGHSPFIKKGGS